MVAGSIAVAAGVLLCGSALRTNALWTDSASLDGGAVSSGQLSLLTGDTTTQVVDYAFDELAGAALRPASWAQAPLTVVNAGSVDLSYRLSGVSATDPALGGSLLLSVDQVPAAAACATGLGAPGPDEPRIERYTGSLLAGQTVARPLSPAAGEVLCIRVRVDSSIPPSLQATTSRITFTFTATATRAG